jgi:hypothetical protein
VTLAETREGLIGVPRSTELAMDGGSKRED